MVTNVHKSSYTLRCETMARKFGAVVPNGDIWNVGLRCGDNVEEMAQLTAAEKFRFCKGERRRRFGYSHTLLHLGGKIDLKQAFHALEELIKEQPLLRTQYIFDDVSAPLRIVNAPSPATFPVLDLRQTPEKQAETMQNTLAAELHREYDPQSDPILRIRGFITRDESLSLMVSVCRATGFEMPAEEIAARLFGGMKILAERATPTAPEKEKKNEEAVSRAKELFANIKPQSLPGYISDSGGASERCVVYKTLDWEFAEKIRDHCYDSKISRQSFFLTAWAELQGRFNSADEVILALHGAGSELYPIKADRSLRTADCAADIAKQAAEMSGSDFQELCEAAGISEDAFLTEHRFIDLTGDSAIENSPSSPSDMMLSISYILRRNKSGIIYDYRSGSFYGSAIERIHLLFTSIIDELMSPEQKRVDLWKILKISDRDEAQLRKANIAYKAKCLFDSGLFPSAQPEELTRLAERARTQDYAADTEILRERRTVGEIALITEGLVEESKTGADGIVKSVSMLKKGDIFSVKALLDDNVSAFTYTAASENVQVLWIKREDLITFADMSPAIWRALLERVSAGEEKMKRLWTIV